MNQKMADLKTKLPGVSESIFSTMSRLAAKHNAINLAQGFPDFDCDHQLKSLVTTAMADGFNQYAPMPGVPLLRDEIAALINRKYNVSVDADSEITICSGATQGLAMAIAALVGEDDEVIVFEPAYDSYVPMIQLNGGRAINYALHAPDYKIDWERVKRLINARTRMIIINSPHNPVGSVFKPEDYKKLARLLDGTDIIVLSDEVYEHIVFDEQIHRPLYSEPRLRNRTVAVSSFGKTYHTTGWKVGYVVASEELSAEIRKIFQFAQFSVSSPFQHAYAHMLKESSYIDNLSGFYQKKRDLFRSRLEKSRFRLLPCEGTYFQCVSYEQISKEGAYDMAVRLTKDAGVASIPVSAFYRNKTEDYILRFCFAKNDETLEAATEKLCRI